MEYSASGVADALLMDMDGDGFPDQCARDTTVGLNEPTRAFLECSTGSGIATKKVISDYPLSQSSYRSLDDCHLLGQSQGFRSYGKQTCFDLNGDGMPDKVLGFGYNFLNQGWQFAANPNGFFWKQWAQHDYETDWEWERTCEHFLSGTYGVILFADINGDHLPDRIMSNDYPGRNPTETRWWVQINNGEELSDPVEMSNVQWCSAFAATPEITVTRLALPTISFDEDHGYVDLIDVNGMNADFGQAAMQVSLQGVLGPRVQPQTEAKARLQCPVDAQVQTRQQILVSDQNELPSRCESSSTRH